MATPNRTPFLEGVERRAFKHAVVYMVRNEESALISCKIPWIKLSEKYGDKPADELPCCSNLVKIPSSTFFRREKVRNNWVSFSEYGDPMMKRRRNFDLPESFSSKEGSEAESTENKLEREQVLNIIDDEIKNFQHVNEKPF